jgi:hypothetical protein
MTPLHAALQYADSGLPVFPCKTSKAPLTENGFRDATTDVHLIHRWWSRWPAALISAPTGLKWVVLDVDVKDPDPACGNGFDSLADLGFAIWPETPTAHTPSGGAHLYFALPDQEIRNTVGKRGRGIGHGLDWRGTGGSIILASSAGYRWDPHLNPDIVAFAAVPPALMPREPVREAADYGPIAPPPGLSKYALAALDDAARKIIAAPNGQQEATINGEAFGIGTLDDLPNGFALDVLVWAARQVPSLDPRRPWRPGELEEKVRRSFKDGRRHPRRRAS